MKTNQVHKKLNLRNLELKPLGSSIYYFLNIFIGRIFKTIFFKHAINCEVKVFCYFFGLKSVLRDNFHNLIMKIRFEKFTIHSFL